MVFELQLCKHLVGASHFYGNESHYSVRKFIF